MTRYRPTVDVWALSEDERAALQVGQWVTAGEGGPRGRFYGHGSSTVVAWQGNAQGHPDYRSYQRTLHQYGQSIRKRKAA